MNAKKMLRDMRVSGGGAGREKLPSPQESNRLPGRIGVMRIASDRSKLPRRVASRDYRKRQMGMKPILYELPARGEQRIRSSQGRGEGTTGNATDHLGRFAP